MVDKLVERHGLTLMDRPAHPTFFEATHVWAKIGLLSFGGPAGQIALMHKELVDDRGWISERRFLHALNFCMLLPGPEAQQLATYIGWLLHGWRGGVVAGLLFILPGFLVILGLSSAYAMLQHTTWMGSVFFGLKAAVLAIVIEAVIRVARRSLKNNLMRALAGLAFISLFFFNVAFPIVVLVAGLIGYVGYRFWPDYFAPSGHGGTVLPDRLSVIDDETANRATSRGRALLTIGLWGALWALPFGLIAAFVGPNSVYLDISTFFSKMSVVTFGGAYAVLSYVAQQAVENYRWLSPGEMLDGLALAETTPGPLVLVLTFVGFLAAFRDPGSLSPLMGGLTGAFLTTWMTFVPCFLWIFLFAPYVEMIHSHKALSGALAAISAAVTGVILNLAIWFGLHVLFSQVDTVSIGPVEMAFPAISTINWAASALAFLSALLIFRFKLGTLAVLLVCGILGLLIAL